MALVPTLSVAENVMLNDMVMSAKSSPMMNWSKLRTDAKKVLERLHIDVNVRTLVQDLSLAQKQMVLIARAIAKDPKIYLFDDSFSALDYKTDVTLRRALKEETDNATVIIVAQRISTVLHANQILVLDDGRLVGKGTHAQLMATCPEYQEIARSQLSQKELNLQDLNTGKEDE